MAEGAQCGEEGPFFPTTPRNVIQNGISINDAILITPDWLLIGLMLACFFIVVLIIVLALVSFVLFYYFLFVKIMKVQSHLIMTVIFRPRYGFINHHFYHKCTLSIVVESVSLSYYMFYSSVHVQNSRLEEVCV